MDPVIVSPISTIGCILAVIGGGAALAIFIRSEQRHLRIELRSLSERLSALDRRLSGLDRRLAWLEGAFPVAFACRVRLSRSPVAFALPRPPAAGTESPPASVTWREHR